MQYRLIYLYKLRSDKNISEIIISDILILVFDRTLAIAGNTLSAGVEVSMMQRYFLADWLRVVSQLFLDTEMKIFLKIRGNIRGIFKEKRGNNIQFASNTGRKFKIENVYQLNFCGSVQNILILTENESTYGGTVIIKR